MKTKELNVNREQYKFMEDHKEADEIICSADGKVVGALYHSPIKKWGSLMKPNGTVKVPDMDYYNRTSSIGEIHKLIDELAQLI